MRLSKNALNLIGEILEKMLFSSFVFPNENKVRILQSIQKQAIPFCSKNAKIDLIQKDKECVEKKCLVLYLLLDNLNQSKYIF